MPALACANRAELAVVVLAVGEMPELPAAVASLVAQGEPLEIVIVRSATASTVDPSWLPRGAREIRSPALLPTGAARNRGIGATQAPWVAFLAGDNRALPGWAAGRLAAHRTGAEVVASAVVNGAPSSLVAWAGYIALHHRRWPRVPAHEALHYGCSYPRNALEQVGGFRDELAAGEDTELHARLARSGWTFTWVPAVRATQPYATDFGDFLRDQLQRGASAAHAWLQLGDFERATEIGRQPLTRAARALRFALRYAEPGDRARVALAAPLVALAARSYARGARRERESRDRR